MVASLDNPCDLSFHGCELMHRIGHTGMPIQKPKVDPTKQSTTELYLEVLMEEYYNYVAPSILSSFEHRHRSRRDHWNHS